MAKFCSRCGKELQEGMKFCSGCGAPVEGSAPGGMPGSNAPGGMPGSNMPGGMPGSNMSGGMPGGMPGSNMSGGMPGGMPGGNMATAAPKKPNPILLIAAGVIVLGSALCGGEDLCGRKRLYEADQISGKGL